MWLFEDKQPVKREVRGRAKAVLTAIAKDWDAYVDALKGVIVVSGPGSFSSIRTGVLYGNLFSRFLGLPMYEVKGEGELNAHAALERIKSDELKRKGYIEPVYDREPNITVPKS